MKHLIFSFLLFTVAAQAWVPCYESSEQLYCWGTGNEDGKRPRLEKVEALYTNERIGTGCAWDEVGLHCWGYAEKDPVKYDQVQEASYGSNHTCYLQRGRVHCFGLSLPKLDGVLGIASFDKTFCALDAHQVRCFGGERAQISVEGQGFTRIAYDRTLIAAGAKGAFRWDGAWKPEHLKAGEVTKVTSVKNPITSERITCLVQKGVVSCNRAIGLTNATDIWLSSGFGYCARTSDNQNHCWTWGGGLELKNVPPSEFIPLALVDDGYAGRIFFASANEIRYFAGSKGEDPFAGEPRIIKAEGVSHITVTGRTMWIRKGRRELIDYQGSPRSAPLPDAKPRGLQVWRVPKSYPEVFEICGWYGDQLECASGSADYYGWKTHTESVPGMKAMANECRLYSDRIDCGANEVYREETFPNIGAVETIFVRDGLELCAKYADKVRCWQRTLKCAADFPLEAGDELATTGTYDGPVVFGKTGARNLGFVNSESCNIFDKVLATGHYDHVVGSVAEREGRLYSLSSGEESLFAPYFYPYGLREMATGLNLFRAQVPDDQWPYLSRLSGFVLNNEPSGPLPSADQPESILQIFTKFLVFPYLGQASPAHKAFANRTRQAALYNAWRYKVRWVKDFRRLTGVPYRDLWNLTANFMFMTSGYKASVLPDDPAVKRLVELADTVQKQAHAPLSLPAEFKAFRDSIVELGKAYRLVKGTFENDPRLRTQIEGDEFALWYLEGI